MFRTEGNKFHFSNLFYRCREMMTCAFARKCCMGEMMGFYIFSKAALQLTNATSGILGKLLCLLFEGKIS